MPRKTVPDSAADSISSTSLAASPPAPRMRTRAPRATGFISKLPNQRPGVELPDLDVRGGTGVGMGEVSAVVVPAVFQERTIVAVEDHAEDRRPVEQIQRPFEQLARRPVRSDDDEHAVDPAREQRAVG